MPLTPHALTRRRLAALLGVALPGAALPRAALADGEDWPARPVNVVVPFAPGGATDLVARVLAEELRVQLGRPFVVENRAGAAGTIGVEFAARAVPDGYTLLFATQGTMTINPHLYRASAVDIQRDLVPVTQTFSVDHVLVVPARSPATSVAQLTAMARERPGQLTYGSAGVGSSVQLYTVLYGMLTGISLLHVPYRGSSPALMDVIAGRIDMLMDSVPSSITHIRSGAVRPLAVTGRRRNAALPEVPTMAEAGVTDFEAAAWGAFMVPAGTPETVVARLGSAVRAAYAKPAVVRSLADKGTDAVASSREELAQLIARDTERWGRVVREARITLE
ncbi:tripartite tricarboxylate transporter substrate binding protein [Roseomonas sp. OT10]|uniref:Bug family tripartite tricarboxylate transporter substrate binding protein n=1 Tax=Roseomonas cutis TaxID=2897332 RepID=UPI001E4E08B2|nr:tripartite tricarboxylate transporter substrate binding protein [Roseomonas sp. OT10]UFN48418.1 tripartite tricarboxylate transporter substrate binding protein [Roseomonas sp. OT10]